MFFDVRCAKALVQRVGADAGTGWLEKTGPEERREGKGKVEARFVTAEEALEVCAFPPLFSSEANLPFCFFFLVRV